MSTTTAVTPEPVIVNAPAPSRSCGSLTLGFGLLSIPVKVYAGTEDRGIKRSEFCKVAVESAAVDGIKTITESYEKVGRLMYYTDPTTSDPVVIAYSDIVKRYEAPDGTLIELSDAEIAAAVGRLNGEAQILSFQPLAFLNDGTYLIESLYQVRPAKRGSSPDPVAQRAFSLLMQSMERVGRFGLVQYVMNGKIRYAALTSDGVMLGLRYTGEIRQDLPLAQVEVTEPELAAAAFLIDSITTNEPTALVDVATDKVNEYAAKKAALDESGRVIAGKAVETLPDASASAPTAFTELMEKLAASVAAASAAKVTA